MRIFEDALHQLKSTGKINCEIYYHFSDKTDKEIHKSMKSFNESFD